MFALDPDDLDARETLAAASEMRDLQAEAEVAELRLGLRFVDLHPDPRSLSDGPGIPGGERGVVYGGDGCPAVAEFAAAEFGAVTGRSAPAAARFLGEALALRHRLPLIYAQMLSGHAAPWKARKIAAACMELSFEAAAIVDQRVAAIIDSVTPLRLANIVRAAMWQADPDTARAVAEARARTRGVWAVRTDDHGTTMLFVRASTGNVIRLKATITQIADALAVLGDTDSLDQRRAKAIGVIADPALADKLLQVAHHLTTTRNTDTDARTAPGIGTETGTESGIGTKADTSTGTGTSTDIGASTGIGTSTGTGIGTNASTNASTNAGTNAGTEVGTEAEIPAVPEDLAEQHPAAPPIPTPHPAVKLTPRTHNSEPAEHGLAQQESGTREPITQELAGWESTEVTPATRELAVWEPAKMNPTTRELAVWEAAEAEPQGHGFDDRGFLEDREFIDDSLHPSDPAFDDYPLDPSPSDDPSRPPTEAGAKAEEADDRGMNWAARRELNQKLNAIQQHAHTGRRPRQTILYTHITDETLLAGHGVARVEGYGPVYINQLHELLGHDQITIQPVIDLNTAISVDAYEIPRRIREHVKLTYPVEQFPYGTAATTNSIDIDHTKPFDPNGPPGQTSTTNLTPLRRFSHRVKTRGHWKVDRIDDHTLEWTTRYGFKLHVNQSGTHRIDGT